MDDFVRTVARFVFAIPMLVFGFFHFTNISGMAFVVPGWLPLPGEFWVVLTGAAFILAGISIIIRVLDYWASFLLGLMLLIFALTVHLPGIFNDVDGAMTNFLKDIVIAGGAWFYTAYAAKKPAE